MELFVAAALIAVIAAWWFARSKAQGARTADQQPTPDYRPIPPALRTDLPAENTSPSEPAIVRCSKTQFEVQLLCRAGPTYGDLVSKPARVLLDLARVGPRRGAIGIGQQDSQETEQ